MATTPHPWILTAPWYRWDAPGVPEAGRGTRPEIQKYAGFDLGAEFLREPQRSLKWKDEDYLHRSVANTAALPPTLRALVRARTIALVKQSFVDQGLEPPPSAEIAATHAAEIDSAYTQAQAIVDRTSGLSVGQQAAFINLYFTCFSEDNRAGLIAALVNPNAGSYIQAVPARQRWLLEALTLRSNCPTSIGGWLREKTGIRKLYKPAHARSYMVVAQLGCDKPGLPRVARGEVAEAGFVIRRLRARIDDPKVALAATTALQEIAMAREQVGYLQRNAMGRIRSAAGLMLQRRLERPIVKQQAALLEQWSLGKLELDELAATGAVGLEAEAWIPDPLDPLRGRWQLLSEATPRLELGGEAFEPMHPLIPDPREPNHSAARQTLYFGVIPTGARAAEDDGGPRFDERHIYEIRCFVRRQPSKPGCPGELVWSEATIGYRVALDADPEGTANMPLSITVPSFRDIKAFADNMATGGAGGLRVVQPPDSMMPMVGTFPDAQAGPKSGIGQICFIALFLLFMIALFLVFAFLPIIVFMFQLFFMLRLKFCIPPIIEIDIEVAAEFKAQLEVDFDVEASFTFGAQVLIDAGITDVESLGAWVDDQLGKVYDGDLLDALLDAPLATRMQRLVDLRTDFRDSVDPDLASDLGFNDAGKPTPGSPAESMAPPLPRAGGALEYYAVIDPQEVFG